MNNKRLGTEFEKEVCEALALCGYWAHFIVPDARGAQPFDIVAAKDGHALAIDCKTCVAKSFNITRLEDNQTMAFRLWRRCGNGEGLIFVKHKGKIYVIGFDRLIEEQTVPLNSAMTFDEWSKKDDI